MENLKFYPEIKITREEINIKIKEFLMKGGKIRILPPQVENIKNMITVRFAEYEEFGANILGVT